MPTTIDSSTLRVAAVHGERTDLALVVEWSAAEGIDLVAHDVVTLTAEVVVPDADDLEFSVRIAAGTALGRLRAVSGSGARELESRALAFHADGHTVMVAFPHRWASSITRPSALVATIEQDRDAPLRAAGLLAIARRGDASAA